MAVMLSGCASSPSTPPVELTADAFASAHRLTRLADVPRLVARKEPYLPHHLNGTNTDVTIDVLVDRTGVVVGSRRTDGDERFYASAAAAAQQWRFEPLLIDGEATAFVLPVRFTLMWPDPRRAGINIRYVLAE